MKNFTIEIDDECVCPLHDSSYDTCKVSPDVGYGECVGNIQNHPVKCPLKEEVIACDPVPELEEPKIVDVALKIFTSLIPRPHNTFDDDIRIAYDLAQKFIDYGKSLNEKRD